MQTMASCHISSSNFEASGWIDVVWDFYTAYSLKAHTRECHGTGHRFRVSERTRLQQNWRTFLLIDSNKTELFQFLASAIESAVTPEGKVLVMTKGEMLCPLIHRSGPPYYDSLRPSPPAWSEQDHGPCHQHGCTCTFHCHCRISGILQLILLQLFIRW